MIAIRISPAPFDPPAAMAAFLTTPHGAVASFTGLCRADPGVTRLELEHYPGFTECEIERIAHAIAARFNLAAMTVLHRIGAMSPGDAIVFVAAGAPHRAEAFAALEAMMDYLKTDAPFWKREVRADGARWIEPTAKDRDRRARWEMR
jgi:molybdopterin synthase catalytic subunit